MPDQPCKDTEKVEMNDLIRMNVPVVVFINHIIDQTDDLSIMPRLEYAVLGTEVTVAA